MEYIFELLNILNAMSPYLLLGFLIAGLLHVYIPKTAYSKYLSQRGFKSVFLAALFGVPLPLCSCGVIPTAMSLKKEGASDGATVSFLIATPQTGVDSLLATYGVFGLPFAIIRAVVALIVGVVGGLIVDSSARPQLDTTTSQKPQSSSATKIKKLGIVDALKYGFVDMLQDLGGWLAVGLIIAASITAFVPSSVFQALNDHYILNISIVLLLSVPMYICSTGSIPIALSLLMQGVSPGGALIFLMAGPATNVATLTVVRKVLGTRTTILYLLSIILGAVAFAVFIDFALPAEWFVAKLTSVGECSHGGGSGVWWQTASSVLFVALLVNAYVLKFFFKMTHSHGDEKVAVQRFSIKGLRCNHCKANAEKAIATLPNVVAVEIDLTSGVAQVEGDLPSEQICKAVSALGFEIEILD